MNELEKSLIDKTLGGFTKKELLGWFVILELCFIIIGLVIWKFNSFQEIVDQVSFAASIASIVLAILAIVYAFLQSNLSSEQYTFLRANLAKIDQQQNIVLTLSNYLVSINKEISNGKDINQEKIKLLAEDAMEVVNNINRTRPRS